MSPDEYNPKKDEEFKPADREKKPKEETKSFICQKCMKNFISENNLQMHIRQRHPENDDENSAPNVNENTNIHAQNDLEDDIYAFLGELGEQHLDRLENISESLVFLYIIHS